MKRQPDFIGNFMLLEDEEQQKLRERMGGVSRKLYRNLAKSGGGIFYMFIDKREKKEGVEEIFGTIEDKVGIAVFEGELRQNSIKFIKRYFKEYLPGAMPETPISYEGCLESQGFFRGKYSLQNIEGYGIFVLYPAELYIKEGLEQQKN